MRAPCVAISMMALWVAGCDSGGFGDDGGGGGGGGGGPVAPGGGATCSTVRLTNYTASERGWCEFNRELPILPQSVRDGMTLAISEPWNGGSYQGASGEACGECWEIDTISGTRTVMVHDLCPIEGNPLCAGAFFHFDLSSEAAGALGGGGLDAASTRRVPCPVSGNVYLELLDRNEWGYVRFAVVNHRVPVRLVEYRPAGGGAWRPAERSGGAWHIRDGGDTFASGAGGGVFRLTSAQGEVLETTTVLGYGVAKGSTFDLGAQLTDQSPPSGPACVFVPPGDVYVDGYGGIDQVRWQMNPWNGASASETTSGCAAGSCIRVSLAAWSGFHIYYRQAFPTSTFATLSMKVKAASGSGTIEVRATNDGPECTGTTVTPGSDWSTVTIALTSTCASLSSLNSVTVQATPGNGLVLLLDDVRFLN